MSTEPLLPSYAAVTGRQGRQNGEQQAAGLGAGKDSIISATPVIQSLAFLVFIGTAAVSTLWAYRSDTASDPTPPASAPLLPYFASLALVVSFGCWVGYVVFISYDAGGGPRVQRRIVIWTSAVGKLVLAGVHLGIGRWYRSSFPHAVQPNWALVFLAAQAWWDCLLLVVYSRLRTVECSE